MSDDCALNMAALHQKTAQMVVDLAAKLDAANARIAELEAALKAARGDER